MFCHCCLFLHALTARHGERFPGAPGRTTDLSRAQKTQEVMGGFDSFGQSIGKKGSKEISGIVRLAKGLKVPSKDYMIFVSARPLQGGPPVAVKRMKAEKFPFRFSLSEANEMMRGAGRFQGFLDVTIRIDQAEEGGGFDPLSRQSGDLFGKARLQVSNTQAEILIDQTVE